MSACTTHTGDTLFCSTCGKVREPGALRTVKLEGFTGRFSLNPKMEKFKMTGDPAVFDEP